MIFWFHKEPFSQRFFKEPCLSYLFIVWRTFFHNKEPFVKQKGSSDVKCSLWNHLEKKVLLWHREAPLSLRVSVYLSSIVLSIVLLFYVSFYYSVILLFILYFCHFESVYLSVCLLFYCSIYYSVYNNTIMNLHNHLSRRSKPEVKKKKRFF